MKTLLSTIFILLVVFAQAQVTSTFDTDADGWTAAHLGGTVPTTTYQSAGGNPGGHMQAAPPTSGGTVNTSFTWYWHAPAKFFGNADFSYGANLKVDLQQSVAGTDNTQSDIIIYGPAGHSIHFQLPNKPAVSPAWTSYSVALDENAGWRYNSVGGALALKPQLKIVLSNITDIYIRCKYINSAGYTSGMDNVILEKPTSGTGPVITSFTPVQALPGSPVTITGSNFGSTASNNIVYFGNVKAEIVSASSTQVVATVPDGATFNPISIINTSIGRVATSAMDFSPLVFSDPDLIGHIIPGSFATNVIVPYADFNDNGLAGAELGDVDGDGLLDIIAFEDPGEFAIFLNQGQTGDITSTSFSSKIEIPSGELGQGNSSGTLLADFDNDGKIDIVTFFRGLSPSLSGGFAVSRNISTPGNVSFETPEQFYNIGIFCSGLDAADLDGDGRLEVLINSSGLRYARNISTPVNIEFASIQSLDPSGGAVTTKDLNGDGKPEVIVVGTGNYSLLENISTPGNIQFSTPVVFPGSVVSGVTMADLDNDSKADILYYRINGFNNYDLVMKKNIHTTGALSLASFDSDIIISKVGRAYSQRVADLNGDGRPEILIGLNSGSTGYGFGVFENNTTSGILNTSSFLPIVEFEETSIGVLAIPMIGDLNGDNQPDVVGFAYSDGGEHALILYQNQTISAPHISVNTITPLAAPVGSTVTITGDKFSTDPIKNNVWFGGVKGNVLTASKTELTVEVPFGANYERVSVTRDYMTTRYHLPFITTFSPGTTFDATSFLPPVSFPLTGADYDVEVADLNADGKPEIIAESRVVTGIIRNYAWSYKNVHTSGIITTSSFIVTDTTNDSALNLRMVDLDEDGRPDILSQNAIFRNTTITDEVEFDNNVGGASGGIQAWADFDMDGKTDVIAANLGAGSLSVYRNHSRPGPFRVGAFATFSAAINLTKPSVGGGTAVGDFDNDGLPEFVSTNPNTDNMSFWRNTGGFPLSAAQFVAVGNLATGDNPSRVYPGDLDVDGKMDLLVYHWTGTSTTLLCVFHNQSTPGNIVFNRVDFNVPATATLAHIGDLDGDGKPEILVTSEGTDQFFILKNTSTPGVMNASSFAAPFATPVTNPRGITTGDLNADGKPEIIITSNPNSLLVFENAVPTGPTISITSQPTSTAVCNGSNASLALTATGTTNLTYQWQKFDGSVFINVADGGGYSGATTATLGINTTGNFGAGDYRCEIKGDLAPDRFSNTVTLTVNVVPAAPTTTGSSNCVASAITLNASGGTNGQYRWYDVATGGTPISGQVNSSYTTPVISATTTYHVAIYNGFCEGSRSPVIATIAPIAKPTLTPSVQAVSGTINICAGDALTITAPAGFASYTWSNGASTNPITITTSTPSLTLQVTDGAGCTSTISDALSIIVNPYPIATITPNGSVLTASPGDSYQWYQNGSAAAGATSQSFEFNLLEYGKYFVDVTDNGCTSTSAEFEYLITNVEPSNDGFKLYPNPVEKILITEYPPPYTSTIINTSGMIVGELNSSTREASIDLNALAAGVYFLRLKNENGVSYHRITKK